MAQPGSQAKPVAAKPGGAPGAGALKPRRTLFGKALPANLGALLAQPGGHSQDASNSATGSSTIHGKKAAADTH